MEGKEFDKKEPFLVVQAAKQLYDLPPTTRQAAKRALKDIGANPDNPSGISYVLQNELDGIRVMEGEGFKVRWRVLTDSTGDRFAKVLEILATTHEPYQGFYLWESIVKMVSESRRFTIARFRSGYTFIRPRIRSRKP